MSGDRLRARLGRLRRIRIVRFALLLACLWGLGKAIPRLIPKAPLCAGFGSSTAVHDRHGALLRLTLSADDRFRLWTPLERVSPQLIEAFLLYEDRHFRLHPGVNPAALGRAIWSTYVSRERRIGGSTITMQLARRLHGIDSSTVSGKLRQMGRALQLELLYTKDEILEAYLNLVPMGGNVEGVGAAAWIYFGKPASRLTLGQALALAVIPQNPGKRRGVGRCDDDGRTASAELETARTALLETWTEAHGATDEARLARLPLTMGCPSGLPFLAPHFVDGLLASPRRGYLQTSLDLGLQRLVERQLRSYVDRRRREGLRNGAVLLVDRRDMGVRAAVGSADYFDRALAGQVDGTRARRSPASTIKPLIYALALEQGLVHPRTLLRDTPTRFGEYRPENFDHRFSGPVTAQAALLSSRNVPAVELASRLERPTLHGLLRRAGVQGLRPEEHYGLSLALGGFELTMQELAALYAALGNRGLLRPLRATTDEAPVAPRRLLGPEAAFVTVQMLLHNPRPDRLAHALPTALRDHQPAVAWKTGTSFGFRDAWTAGLFGPYVLVVWIGNFSGEGNPALVGASAAAPLFFSIVDAVTAADPGMPPLSLPRPAGVKRVAVCAVSGDLPGPHCPHRRQTWYIPGRSPIRTCRVHRQIMVDASGLQACPPYPGPVRAEVHEFWPSDLARLFAEAGVPRRQPPAAGPSCPLESRWRRGTPPRITSPSDQVAYAARGRRSRIALAAAVDADVRELHWFIGERYLGRSGPDRPLWWQPARAGEYVVRAVDDAGRADSRTVRVLALTAPCSDRTSGGS